MAVKPQKTALAGHTAGIFADMTLDGPEIGTLVAVIDRAKNLPNRKTMGKQDPYCAMRLGKEARKTNTDRRGGQTPKWDQELRFTVHDSPDYYRLKCSVFNDDKKTDLIGEAWIDLSDLIKPGGGSNDLWHQLNYKGKYAGDVRIELTYYDLRPREEKVAEKKKTRERAAVTPNDSSPAVSLPRQLGPREVRQRPLPPNPTSTGATAESVEQTHIQPALQDDHPPPRPPKIPQFQEENSWSLTTPQKQEQPQITTHPYADSALVVQPRTQNYRQPFIEEPSPALEYSEDPIWNSPYTQPSNPTKPSPSSSMVPSPASLPLSWQDENESWEYNGRSGSQSQIDTDPEYHTPFRALPCPPTHSSEQHHRSAQSNTTPNKSTPYRDSPLRQSMNQEHLASYLTGEPESFDVPPPPPPMHRETMPRRRQTDLPPSAFPNYDQSVVPFAPRPVGTNSRRASIEERSPLQQIEHQYDPYVNSQNPGDMTRWASHESYQEHQSQPYDQLTDVDRQRPSRYSSYDEYQGHDFSHQGDNYHSQEDLSQHRSRELSYDEPYPRGQPEHYDDPRLNGNRGPVDEPYARNSRPHSRSHPHATPTEYHKPTPVRPRPSDVNPNHKVQRKAISPGPSPREDGRRLSGVPFNPDAYDVLNPASSPAAEEGPSSQLSNHTRESARMREVEKLRDQGPIIGNDGRVIDPSDHLPSDTWAPEPQRKQRRPEHVVHIRTKNEARSRTKPPPAPVATNGGQHWQSPTEPSPYSSPVSLPPSGGRNRLQKAPPSRSLPTQPYAQGRTVARSQDGPRSAHTPASEVPSQRATQRYSYHDTSPGVHRPQLSEYQVPASNSYVPRRSSFQEAYQPDYSQPQIHAGREYNTRSSDRYTDPLAAEMSMIDIGPSRAGQMVVSRRGYQ